MNDRQQKRVPLEWAKIGKLLGDDAVILNQSAVFNSITSTNDWALECCRDESRLPALCLAEHQQQGRGRRGRDWSSPPGCNIYMSLAWLFHRSAAELGALSLALGVSVVRALRAYGIDAQLKWPNDILVSGSKIAGILIESRVGQAQRTAVVIGLGMNYDMPAESAGGISQSWTDFLRACPGTRVVDRNQLAADLVSAMIKACNEYAEFGFEAFRKEWYQSDVCVGKTVNLTTGNRQISGRVLGVDGQGAIEVMVDGSKQRFFAADISLRVQTRCC